MKKTIALLLAMAGVAMADQPINLDWTQDSAKLPNDTDSLTVAYTLDWNAFKNSTGDVHLFSLVDQYEYKHGMGTQDGQFIGSWYADYFGGGAYEYYLLDFDTSEIMFTDIPTYCVFIYTFEKNGDVCSLNEYLYFWDSNKNSLGQQTVSAEASSDYYPFNIPSSIEINSSYVNKESFEVYTDVFDETTRLAIAEGFLPSTNPNTPSTPESPAAPEPTTATLSLLALAGLAARRRRK